ncbi:MAG: electron transfer flavoprotein subunit alpha/FixB family protein [Deltaproteobacteria bacterium]|nr:electron transfer flavoprotein subunit alpha/FixB family protein [Deltaproteobacteria bacterium]
MGDIFVVIEHRENALRDISREMLRRADRLCEALSADLTAVVLGGKNDAFVTDIGTAADRIITIADEKLTSFDLDLYKEILHRLIGEYHPFMTLIGHTPWGMTLAPALSIKTGLPLATDCVDILMEDSGPKAVRQIYSGKLFSKVGLKESEGYLFTVRSGAFQADEKGSRRGEVIEKEIPADLPDTRKQFIEFVDTAAGEVDISQSELLVSIGRGVGDPDKIPAIKELAEQLGGSLSCSRPIVDKNWLPKYYQVGTSGKSVKPKIYLALGISGAFQHVAGIAGAGTVIAVNKDPMAPIFRFADYGVVADLFNIVDALKEKISQ